MTSVDQEIQDLANRLGVHDSDPEAGILRHCLEQVEEWVRESDGISSSSDLEKLVLSKLQMVVEEIDCDEDFDRLAREYGIQGNDPVFACLQPLFEEDVFGALIQRCHAPDQVVAVIDCRGPKANRRYFTRWHEIAHRLTTHADLPRILFRSGNSPLENLVDEVASRIGFYGPLLEKALRETEGEPFTIQKISAVAKRFPGASFKATLLACVKAHSKPVTFVEFDLGGFRRILHNQLVGKRDLSFLLDFGHLIGESEGFTETYFESEHGAIKGIRFPGASYGLVFWESRNV